MRLWIISSQGIQGSAGGCDATRRCGNDVRHFREAEQERMDLILIMQQDSGMSMQPKDLYRSIIYRRSKPQ